MAALISLRIRLWRAFVKWLTEPIPFPGMTFEPRQRNS
jgi:hypothetical protein